MPLACSPRAMTLGTLSILGLALAMSSGPRARAQTPGPRPVSFNREILPILSNNCFACHGPDEGSRETRFHFDTEEGAFK
jgi:mono/diheme cytochrome c family protein